MCIKFWSFLQSSLLRESTKKGRLKFRASLWKRKFKNFETRHSLYGEFFLNWTQKSKINDRFSNRSIIEYRAPQGLILCSLLFNINMIDILY